MGKVLLSIGSNIDQQRYIAAGLDALSEQFGALLISSIYESVAIGFDGDNFYNLVVGIETELSVGQLSSYLKALEYKQRAPSGLSDDLVLEHWILIFSPMTMP